MTQLIAVHEIQHRDDKGQKAVIAAGAAFETTPEQEAYLLRVGAAREAKGGASAPKVTEQPAAGTGDAADLDTKTKAELIKFAEDNDIEIDASANKPVILDTIEAALAADDDLL